MIKTYRPEANRLLILSRTKIEGLMRDEIQRALQKAFDDGYKEAQQNLSNLKAILEKEEIRRVLSTLEEIGTLSTHLKVKNK